MDLFIQASFWEAYKSPPYKCVSQHSLSLHVWPGTLLYCWVNKSKSGKTSYLSHWTFYRTSEDLQTDLRSTFNVVIYMSKTRASSLFGSCTFKWYRSLLLRTSGKLQAPRLDFKDTGLSEVTCLGPAPNFYRHHCCFFYWENPWCSMGISSRAENS